jgi:anti-anti-sigma factor
MGRFLLERQGSKVKVMVGGDLSADTAPELRELLCAILEDGVTDLSLDFSGTTLLDATGIALLMAAANSFSGADKHMALLSVPRGIFSLLQTLRISQRLGAQMG